MSAQTLLAKWFEGKTAPSQAQFARDINCSESYLSQIIKGGREPSLSLAKRISERTGGAVPIEALAVEKHREAAE